MKVPDLTKKGFVIRINIWRFMLSLLNHYFIWLNIIVVCNWLTITLSWYNITNTYERPQLLKGYSVKSNDQWLYFVGGVWRLECSRWWQLKITAWSIRHWRGEDESMVSAEDDDTTHTGSRHTNEAQTSFHYSVSSPPHQSSLSLCCDSNIDTFK